MAGAIIICLIGYVATGTALAIIGELTENATLSELGTWALVVLLAGFAVVLLVCGAVALI